MADPRAEIRAVEEAKRAAAVVDTFGAFVDAQIERIKGGFKNEKHIYQWRQTLGPASCPSIRGKKLSEITTDDVLGVLEPIWQVKNETASWLRGRIELVLDAGRAKGLRTGENPTR